MAEIPEGAWFLRGDRGLTYAREIPEGSRVAEGRWWAPDYHGDPLISLDVQAARAVGHQVGDTITVSILGRAIEASIATFSEINWDTKGYNLSVCFTPGLPKETAPTHL